MATIFIDGEAGTTGLQIREKLDGLSGIRLASLAPEARKDPAAKQKLYAEVDVVILCLPDEAAKEAAKLIDAMGESAPRVIDASSAHRVAPGWTYGFPELVAGQGEAIAGANKVTNPGCHATGAIALLRPLTEAGLLPKETPVTITSVSGYSGGGKAMIEAYESAGRRPSSSTRSASGTSTCRRSSAIPASPSGRSSCPRSAISVRACWSASRCISKRCRASRRSPTSRRRSRRTTAARATSRSRLRPTPPASSRNRSTARTTSRSMCSRRGPPACGAGREVRQPRQGGLGRGGAEPHADARALKKPGGSRFWALASRRARG